MEEAMSNLESRLAPRWALLCLIALLGTAVPASAATDPYRVVDGLAVYLGLLPAEMVRGHPPSHPEADMHGGIPGGPHDYHVVVALFDAASGMRVEDAEATAVISGLGHIGHRRVPLEPMAIADTITFGEFVTLPRADHYTIEVEIRRPEEPPVRVEFTYRHSAP
jgi:hypothetical protein